MHFLNKLTQKLTYGLFWFYVLGRLEHMGILIRPFYLVKEGMVGEALSPTSASHSEYVMRRLSNAEIEAVASYAQSDLEIYLQRGKDGCQCFGLIRQDKVAGYMWCNFSHCRSWVTFPLREHEVYLFDARVLKDYRGQGLAPLLRTRLYKQLRAMGYTDFISVTDAFNAPAKRFKEKLKARPIRLYLLIQISRRFKKVIVLRQYSHGAS